MHINRILELVESKNSYRYYYIDKVMFKVIFPDQQQKYAEKKCQKKSKKSKRLILK